MFFFCSFQKFESLLRDGCWQKIIGNEFVEHVLKLRVIKLMSEQFEFVQSLEDQDHSYVESQGDLGGRIHDYAFGGQILNEYKFLLGYFEGWRQRDWFELEQLFEQAGRIIGDVFFQQIFNKILHFIIYRWSYFFYGAKTNKTCKKITHLYH